jgi:hypothetical protein
MPRKPTKKSPAKRMKPKCCACASPGIRKINSTGRWYCDLHFSPFPGTSSGSLIRGAKITPTRDEGRKLEEVRKYLAAVVESEATEPAINVALGGLRILYSTPTAKGGRT